MAWVLGPFLGVILFAWGFSTGAKQERRLWESKVEILRQELARQEAELTKLRREHGSNL